MDNEEKVPFCPECHSYPCSCEDNIADDDWPVHGI